MTINLKQQNKNSGFTLLELLIVIAIIAILSVALVIVLNPSEALKKSRDAQRMSDLSTLKTAIGIYTVNTPSPNMAGVSNAGCKGTASDEAWTNSDFIYYSYPIDSPGESITDKTLDGTTFTTGGASQVSSANLGLNNGSGWLPINFSSLSGGSPISSLPVDPVNTTLDSSRPTNADLVYRYTCLEKNLTYEIDATLESEAYTVTDNKMASDGGNNDLYYEVGTNLGVFNGENSVEVSLVAVGDTYQGGIVAYILEEGENNGVYSYDANVQHGLIAAPSDTVQWARWGCNGTDISGAEGTAIGTGNQNTIDIMAGCSTDGVAARIAGEMEINGYTDWYLPSQDELNKLFINKDIIGNPYNQWYWSSSEIDASNAREQDFYTGTSGSGSKADANVDRIRAIRSF